MSRRTPLEPITPIRIELDDQIRGMAMALRHWFLVEDAEVLQIRAGLLPPKTGKPGKFDKAFRVLAVSALPPQIVRLKPKSPMTTLHFMQDVYDDGVMRADPWRWWFAWIAVELISRTGPDTEGNTTKRFILEDPSVEAVRVLSPRWLAANPTRLMFVETEYHALLSAALDTTKSADTTGGGRTLSDRVLASATHMDHSFIKAMAAEAGKLASAITLRLRERAERTI